MKVLVTGGAGFIGSHIVDILVSRGDEVVIIDDLSGGKKENVNQKARFYLADIRKDLTPIFEKERPEVVIHAAAQVMLRDSLKDPIKDANLNIIGTINVLESCRKTNVKKIIYTSTGGARYGEPDYLPINETHKIDPNAPYGISKHTAEHYVKMYSRLYGIDYLIFCFGNVYGPRDYVSNNRAITLFMDKMIRGESPVVYGNGEQTRDFIYVLDLAKFIVECIDKNPEIKLFNLANGKGVSINEVLRVLKEKLDFKGEIKYVDGIKGEVKDNVLDISLAKKELGWNPAYSLEDGIEENIKWFKSIL